MWQISKGKVCLSVPKLDPLYIVLLCIIKASCFNYQTIIFNTDFSLQDYLEGAPEDPQWREASPL